MHHIPFMDPQAGEDAPFQGLDQLILGGGHNFPRARHHLIQVKQAGPNPEHHQHRQQQIHGQGSAGQVLPDGQRMGNAVRQIFPSPSPGLGLGAGGHNGPGLPRGLFRLFPGLQILHPRLPDPA